MSNAVRINVTNNPVRQLRDLGYKVRVVHYRLYVDVKKVYEALSKPSFNDIRVHFLELSNFDTDVSMALPRGGRTIVSVTNQNGEEFHSEAICSLEDQFNKREGVKKAIGKILKYL